MDAALDELFGVVSRHRQLTWEMTKREIRDRYVGQMLGVVWAVGHPIILMLVYVFIFAYVFKLKIGGTRELPLDYTTYLLSGLIPWMTFQEAMTKGSTVIVGSTNLVKQAVFPLEILPVKGVLASSLNQVIATGVLLAYVLVTHGSWHWTVALLPVLFALQLVAMSGVSFLLAALGAYFRDIKDFVQVFALIGMYLMPIFYLPTMVPEIFRPLLYANPFSYMAWCYQDAFYFGRFEHPWAWVVYPAASVGICLLGYAVFRRLRVGFGGVL